MIKHGPACRESCTSRTLQTSVSAMARCLEFECNSGTAARLVGNAPIKLGRRSGSDPTRGGAEKEDGVQKIDRGSHHAAGKHSHPAVRHRLCFKSKKVCASVSLDFYIVSYPFHARIPEGHYSDCKNVRKIRVKSGMRISRKLYHNYFTPSPVGSPEIPLYYCFKWGIWWAVQGLNL